MRIKFIIDLAEYVTVSQIFNSLRWLKMNLIWDAWNLEEMVPSCSAAQYYPKYLILPVSDLKRKNRFHFFQNLFLRRTEVKRSTFPTFSADRTVVNAAERRPGLVYNNIQYPVKKLGHGLFFIRPHAKFFCRSECRNRHKWLKKNPQIENQVGYLWIFFQKDPTYGLEIVDPVAKSGTTFFGHKPPC